MPPVGRTIPQGHASPSAPWGYKAGKHAATGFKFRHGSQFFRQMPFDRTEKPILFPLQAAAWVRKASKASLRKARGRRREQRTVLSRTPESRAGTPTERGVSRGSSPWTPSLGTFSGARESTSSAGTRPGDLKIPSRLSGRDPADFALQGFFGGNPRRKQKTAPDVPPSGAVPYARKGPFSGSLSPGGPEPGQDGQRLEQEGAQHVAHHALRQHEGGGVPP